MKKAIALLATLVVFTSSAIFAEDAVTLTIEERVAALEAVEAPVSPLSVSGTLTFGIGTDASDNETNKVVAAGTTAATATLGVASADAKVTASVSINLLAAPTVASTYDGGSTWDGGISAGTSFEKSAYDNIVTYVNFWNDHNGDEVNDVEVFTAADLTVMTDALAVFGTDFVKNMDDTPDINLKDATFTAADVDDDNILITALTASDAGDVFLALAEVVNNAMLVIDAQMTVADTVFDMSTSATVAVSSKSALETLLKAVEDDDAALIYASETTRKAINGALDLLGAFASDNDVDASVATTYASNMVTGANITVKELGGVADLAMNFTGKHATAGKFNLDNSGHQEDAVAGYPSVAVSLSNGVVEGVSAGVEVFMNANDNKASADDDSWTFLSDDSQDVVDTKIGFAINAGYTTTISDMTIAADVTYASYEDNDEDTTDQTGLALNASFAGMGANVAVMYAQALEASYTKVAADYTIMGITPSVMLELGSVVTDDHVLAFSKDDASESTAAQFGNLGGMLITGGVSADLGQFLPFASTLGFTYVLLDDADANNVMTGSLSLAPVANATLAVGISKDSATDGGVKEILGYNVAAGYTVAGFTLGVTYANAYNSDKEDASVTMGGTIAYAAGTAKFTGSVTNAWDNDQDELLNKIALGCSVSF